MARYDTANARFSVGFEVYTIEAVLLADIFEYGNTPRIRSDDQVVYDTGQLMPGDQDNNDLPLLLPAKRKDARLLIIPKQSWVNNGEIFPWVASGLCMVSFEPDAVMICCSFVPAN